MPNNRELATLILVSAFVLWAFSQKRVREGSVGVVNALLTPQILVSFAALLAWVGLELWVGVQLSLWSPALAKGTILWTLSSAVVLLFNCTQIDSDDLHFLRRTILATVSMAAFVGFFVNLHVMSLPRELVFQIVVSVLSLMVVVANKPVKAFCEWVLALIGLALVAVVSRQVYLDWQQLDARELLLDFALPVWLTIGLVPFLYLFSIYVAYDAIFRPISWRSRLALLSVLHFRADTVRKGRWYFTRNLREARTFSAARGVVAEFLDDLRRKEQAKLDEVERLRRYSGSQELDDEGRRLDRREFTGTIDALRWLATCQMGWHRRCGRYRCDLLKFLNDDIVGYGLPRESDIRLHVAEDGQLWYAWRRTVTGWCFAIGAAGPPPDQWRYDGPGPPKGFPGKDSSWGDGPFADRVNRNWF